jgi:CAP-Gly domain-containing linker protein 2
MTSPRYGKDTHVGFVNDKPCYGNKVLFLSLPPQQSTVEEKSHVMQLEEELALRQAEIEELQVQLRDPDSHPNTAEDGYPTQGPVAQSETFLLREQLLTAGREHHKESSQLREKYEAAVVAGQGETNRLKATVDRQSQEIIDLKQRVQQATTENMEMMDNWKVRGTVLFYFYIKM